MTIESLVDRFGSDVLSSQWVDASSGQAAVGGGRLSVTSTTGAGYYSVYSADTYDLTSSSIIIQLNSAGNQSLSSLEAYPLQLETAGDDRLFFLVTGGTIYAYKKVSGTSTSLWSTTYSSAAHAWLRIREMGGVTYFDTSTTGLSWTNRYSATNPITVTALKVRFMVGTYSTEASTTSLIVDNVNVPPVSLPTLRAFMPDYSSDKIIAKIEGSFVASGGAGAEGIEYIPHNLGVAALPKLHYVVSGDTSILEANFQFTNVTVHSACNATNVILSWYKTGASTYTVTYTVYLVDQWQT